MEDDLKLKEKSIAELLEFHDKMLELGYPSIALEANKELNQRGYCLVPREHEAKEVDR